MKSNNLRKIAGIISPRWREPSTCAACGGDFTCGATLAGCWCSEIKVSDEVRAELSSRYSGCLCRTCLENAASNSVLEDDTKQHETTLNEITD